MTLSVCLKQAIALQTGVDVVSDSLRLCVALPMLALSCLACCCTLVSGDAAVTVQDSTLQHHRLFTAEDRTGSKLDTARRWASCGSVLCRCLARLGDGPLCMDFWL